MIGPTSLRATALGVIATAAYSGVAIGVFGPTCEECDAQLDLCLSSLPGY